LTKLIKKGEPFVWEAEPQMALEIMVTALTIAPDLQQLHHKWKVMIDMHGFDYVFPGDISLCHLQGEFHSVAYCSKNHTPV
jgi:hypothetical protein